MSPKYQGELGSAALSDINNTHTKVLSLVGKGKRVLEVGCATGYMTKQMITGQQCRVTALEIDPESAELARQAGATVLTGDVQDEGVLEQLDGPFEVVVMADVVEHLREPEIVLSRLRLLLEPNGSLILSVPNIAHWTVRVSLLRGQFEYSEKGILDNSHLRFFTRKSIVRLLQESGYRVVRFESMYVFPLHHHHGLGHFFAKRGTPGCIDGLFGYQFIIQAKAT